MLYFGSISLAVIANVFYHMSMKWLNEEVNPMLSLIVTYLTAAACCIVLTPVFQKDSFAKQLSLIGWPSLALGVSICFLELGFILAYRSGWRLGTAALTCNVAVGLLLVPIGLLLFREHLSPKNIAGICLAMIGLWLLADR